jgi:hypothetical protein
MRLHDIIQSTILKEDSVGPVYHGTDKTFGAFELGMPHSSGVSSSGIFFTVSKAVAQGYGNNVVTATLELEDPVIFDFTGKSTIYFDGKSRSPSDLVNRIAEINDDLAKGYGIPDVDESDLQYELADAGWEESSGLDYIDGVVMQNVDDSMDAFGGEVTSHYVVFSPKQIKVRK